MTHRRALSNTPDREMNISVLNMTSHLSKSQVKITRVELFNSTFSYTRQMGIIHHLPTAVNIVYFICQVLWLLPKIHILPSPENWLHIAFYWPYRVYIKMQQWKRQIAYSYFFCLSVCSSWALSRLRAVFSLMKSLCMLSTVALHLSCSWPIRSSLSANLRHKSCTSVKKYSHHGVGQIC